MKVPKYNPGFLEKYKIRFILCAAVILFGTAGIILGIHKFKSHESFNNSTPETTAVCRDVVLDHIKEDDEGTGPPEKYYSYHYEYTVDGVLYRTETYVSKDVQEGDTIVFHYDPEDPEKISTYYYTGEIKIIFVSVFMIAAALVFGAVTLQKCRNSWTEGEYEASDYAK